MRYFKRYRSYLVAQATGLSHFGWYSVSAKHGLPWALLIVGLTVIGSLFPSPYRGIAIALFFLPGFIGFAVTQCFLVVVHLRDVRGRAQRLR